jgi:hypothetical protein
VPRLSWPWLGSLTVLDSLWNTFFPIGLWILIPTAVIFGIGILRELWKEKQLDRELDRERELEKEPRSENRRTCPKCGGDTSVTWYTSQGSGPCPYCKGKGYVTW